MTLKDFKDGEKLAAAIYVHKPYIILSEENVVLWGGSVGQLLSSIVVYEGTYYDDCIIAPREHDLYLNDNTKIIEEKEVEKKEEKDYHLLQDFTLIKVGSKKEIIEFLNNKKGQS